MLVLNFLCEYYNHFYCVDWQQAFWLFKSLLFQVKRVNRFEHCVHFPDIKYKLQENILFYVFHCNILRSLHHIPKDLSPTSYRLQAAFVTLPNHKDNLRPNILDMMVHYLNF